MTRKTYKPILFSAPMVRAILDGRKTVTRRVLKPTKDRHYGCELVPCELAAEINGGNFFNSQHQPGDTLWVKEAWRTHFMWDDLAPRQLIAAGNNRAHPSIHFEAGGALANSCKASDVGRIRQSIFMMEWMSRIILRVTGVKVERLQDITDDQALKEGVEPLFSEHEKATVAGLDPDKNYGWKNYLWHGHIGKTITQKKSKAWPHQYSGYDTPKGSFSSLWESINGPGSWHQNPWVAAITFEVVK